MNEPINAAMGHLDQIAGKIGERPLGSKRNLAACDYIDDIFKTSGLAVERQCIDAPVWEDKRTRLEVEGQRYVAGANGFSPACDVFAAAELIGSLAELENAELRGMIAVLYGELAAGGGYASRRGIGCPERDQKLYSILENKKPAAIITINPQIGVLQRMISDPEFSIPSVTVPAEVGQALVHHNGKALHLRIESIRSAGKFCNVIGKKAGTRPERVLMCAHFDTKADAPGAIDNGSGVAVMLALAQAFSKSVMPVSLEFVALNGQENGGIGVAEYLRQNEGSLGTILAVINVDGVGQILGTNSITTLASSPLLHQELSTIRLRYPGVAMVDPWYDGDHAAFASRGVPSIAVSSIGITNVVHRPVDTIDWISPIKLQEAVSLVRDVLEKTIAMRS